MEKDMIRSIDALLRELLAFLEIKDIVQLSTTDKSLKNRIFAINTLIPRCIEITNQNLIRRKKENDEILWLLKTFPNIRELTVKRKQDRSGLIKKSDSFISIMNKSLKNAFESKVLQENIIGLTFVFKSDSYGAGIYRLYKLVKLDLSHSNISDAFLTEIALLRNLKSLNLTNCAITNKGLYSVVCNLGSTLTDLNLSFCTDIIPTDYLFLPLTKLNRLSITHCGCCPDDHVIGFFIWLSKQTELTYLEVGLTDKPLELPFQSSQNSFSERWLYSLIRVYESIIQSIFKLINLTHLNLSYCNIYDDDLRSISSSIEHLAYLDLSENNEISDTGISYLLPLAETLCNINLHGCGKLTDDALGHLSLMCNLNVLDISGSLITDNGLSLFASFLSINKLTSLDISNNCYVTNIGIAKIAVLKNLKYLNLSNTKVTKKASMLVNLIIQF